MTNVVVLIGSIHKAFYSKEKSGCYLELKLETVYKDEEKPAEEIFLVRLWKGIYNDLQSISHLKQNLILGIKGRLEKENNEVIVVAEKISILGK